MTMPKIKTIEVKSFRGIRESELDFDGRSVILFGENGHGKSSFVDALEFFFKGSISHLQGSEGVSIDRHGPHVSAQRGDASVSVQLLGMSDALIRTFDAPPKVPFALVDFVQLGAESTFILRRKNLLDFIMAQAAPRYAQLATLIGIEDLDQAELSLMRECDELQSRFDIASEDETESIHALEKLVGQHVVSDSEILNALNSTLAEVGQPRLASLEEIEARKVEIVSGTKSPERTQRATELAQTNASLKRVQDAVRFLERHQDLWIKVDELRVDAESAREVVFERLLSIGQDLLKSNDVDYCPLCQQPIDRQYLMRQIDSRLQTMITVSKKASTIRTLANSLASEITQFTDLLVVAEKQVRQVDAPWNARIAEPIKTSLGNLQSALLADPFKMTLARADEYLSKSRIVSLESLCKKASECLVREQAKLADSEKDKQAVKLVDFLTEAKRLREKLVVDRPNRQKTESALRAAKAVYEIFTDTKKTEVQNVYDNLQSDVRRFYEKVHPAEGVGEITITIPKTRRASAHLKMKFHDHEPEDPRALNSEAHLDSLGLCIFLAFVRRFNGGFPIIVLDDVVSSIDAAHRARVCDLLLEEFRDYQLFVTTHEWLWFEEWHAHQQAYKVENSFKNVRIVSWSLDDGLVLERHRPWWERIDEKLKQADKNGAANEGRRLLEWLLFEMCVSTGTSLQARYEARYIVNELYPPLVKRLKELNPRIHEDNEKAIRALDANLMFGNLLSHNNMMAESVSITEVQTFVQSIRGFHDIFYCIDCRSYVRYHEAAKVIKCNCAKKMWIVTKR